MKTKNKVLIINVGVKSDAHCVRFYPPPPNSKLITYKQIETAYEFSICYT